MKIVVIADDERKEELQAGGVQDSTEIVWQQEPAIVPGADAYIDLLFHLSDNRIKTLEQCMPATIIINSVITSEDQIPGTFIRINGWNSFLKRVLVEASGNEANRPAAEKIFSCFNKTIEWVPGIPGFITPRVISMIINEAWFTLEENVSTKEEIDTAMKLGTNYPYGPFEWGEKIGLKNIHELLSLLARSNSRYQPCALLEKQVLPA
jgi:3-hydroxybutyryl-CoA dehydrogenase